MADPKIIKESLNKADEDYRFASENLREKAIFIHRSVFIFIRLRKNI